MDNKKIEKKIAMSNLSTDTLLNIAKKSKCAVLGEKYLNMAADKNKTVLKTLNKEKKRNKLFLLSFSAIPIAVLTPFFISDVDFLKHIISQETYCRLFVGVSLGLIGCTHLMALMNFNIAFAIVPIITYVVYYYTQEPFFVYLLGTEQKCLAFLILALGNGVVPIIHVYATLWMAITSFFSIVFKPKKRDEKELKLVLQQALDASATLKKKELETLIQDYHPELADLLNGLKITSENKQTKKSTSEQEKTTANEKERTKDSINFDFPKPTTPPPAPKSTDILPLYMGYDAQGKHYQLDVVTFRNLIVAGAQGSGKSNFLRHIIATFYGKADIMVIDPHELDFLRNNNPPNLSVVASKNALQILQSVCHEMERRKNAWLPLAAASINEVPQEQRPKRIILIVDEYADLVKDYPKVAPLIEKIAQSGRKFGVNLIIGMQRPDAKTLLPQISSQFLVTMTFRVVKRGDTKVVQAPDACKIPIDKKYNGLGYLVMADNPILIRTPLAQPIPIRKTSGGQGMAIDRAGGQASGQVGSKVPNDAKNDFDSLKKPILPGQSVVREVPIDRAGGQASGQVGSKVPNGAKNHLDSSKKRIFAWPEGAQVVGIDRTDGQQLAREWPERGHLKNIQYLPAQQHDPGAQFLKHEDLVDQLGFDPRKHGFEKVRISMNGQRKRGYWVKIVSS